MIFFGMQNYEPLSEQEEEYFHLVNCLECFGRAHKILKELISTDSVSPVLTDAASRLAMIEYAKAYTVAHGHAKYRYKLSPPCLSVEHEKLHRTILILRDKVLAHSDLVPKQGRIHHYPVESPEPALVSLNADPKLPKPDKLLSLVEKTIEELKIRRKQLSDDLPR